MKEVIYDRANLTLEEQELDVSALLVASSHTEERIALAIAALGKKLNTPGAKVFDLTEDLWRQPGLLELALSSEELTSVWVLCATDMFVKLWIDLRLTAFREL